VKSKKVKSKVNANQPYKVGETYLIRTVTTYWAGRIVAVGDKEIVMVDAAWIADTGRFNEAVKSGSFSEVEPVPTGTEIVVGRGAIVDAVPVILTIPLGVK